MERDTRQRGRNASASHPSAAPQALAGMSPYRQSVASRNDGRPPTRPITPIKSAQAQRYP